MTSWDLVTRRGLYYAVAFVCLTIGFGALIVRGLNFGIDFRGGGLVSYQFSRPLPVALHHQVIREVRQGLQQREIEAEVQLAPSAIGGGGDQLLIRMALPEGSDSNLDHIITQRIERVITPEVNRVMDHVLPGSIPSLSSQEVVSGSVSAELMRKGIAALIIGSLLIMGWVGLRYNVGGMGGQYALAGILALLHDIGILIGFFAVFRDYLQVNSPFIGALLTVLGFSIHDTIVVFDRIRENLRLRKGRTFAETVNISLIETLSRSIITSLTVLFTLLALFVFGGQTLRDFVTAMLVGVIAGAYSSIFIACQLLVSWAKREERVMPTPGSLPLSEAEIIRPPAITVGPEPRRQPSSPPIHTPVLTERPPVITPIRNHAAGKTARRRR